MANSDRPHGLIALIGASGHGKSSLINLIVGKDVAAEGGELTSLTAEVCQYTHTMPDGEEVHFVDTPGFDDCREGEQISDWEILKKIGSFLKEKYDSNQKLSGIIYVHDINSPKVDSMKLRQMNAFKKLWGTESMKNVMVVTTFWDLLSDVTAGLALERELQTDSGLFKDFCDGGAKFVRSGRWDFAPAPARGSGFLSPQEIVEYFLALDPVFSQMQKEMATGVSVAETSVGSTLLQELASLKLDYKSSFEAVNTELRALKTTVDEDRTHHNLLQRDSAKMEQQLAGCEAEQSKFAAKDELEAWKTKHRNEFDDLQACIVALSESNAKIEQQQLAMEGRNNELAASLQREREDRAIERQDRDSTITTLKELLAAQINNVGQSDFEKLIMQDELVQLECKLKQTQADLHKGQQRCEGLQSEVHMLRAALEKADADREALRYTNDQLERELQLARMTKANFIIRQRVNSRVGAPLSSPIQQPNEDTRGSEELNQVGQHLFELARPRSTMDPSGSPVRQEAPSPPPVRPETLNWEHRQKSPNRPTPPSPQYRPFFPLINASVLASRFWGRPTGTNLQPP